MDIRDQSTDDLKVSTYFDTLHPGCNDLAIQDKGHFVWRRTDPVNVEAGQEIEETRSVGDGEVPGVDTGKPQVLSNMTVSINGGIQNV